MIEAFNDPRTVLRAVELIACAGILISTCELLWNWRDFTGTGLYGWKVLRSRPSLVRAGLLARAADAVLDVPGIFVLLVLRLAAIVAAMFITAGPALHVAVLAVIVATSLILSYRSIFGQDGSDQMSALIFVTLLIAAVSPRNEIVAEASLAFIAIQTALSYAIAGVAKVAGPVWTRGHAAFLIFNTESYGMPAVARALHTLPLAGRVLTWSVVAFEVAFPLVFFLGPNWCWIFLAWGLAFHVLNALVMGLNSFLSAFGAAYPAILFCVYRVDALLH